MPEIKPITDFYDPTKAFDSATRYMQGQQHLALQAQQVGIQQQQAAAQQKNLTVDNLQKAYATANPMETFPIAKQLAQELGLPVPNVNTYYANQSMYDKLLGAEPGTPEAEAAMKTWVGTDPRSRAAFEQGVNTLGAFRGTQELVTKAGLGGSEDVTRAVQASGPLQTQVGQVVAQTPIEQEKSRELVANRVQHENWLARHKPEMQALSTLTTTMARGIENAEPLIMKMVPIDEKWTKDQRRLGMTNAKNARDEAVALDPELAKFDANREKSKVALQEGLDALHQQEDALTDHLQQVGLGTDNLKTGESIETLEGTLAKISHQIDYTKAHLALAKDATPANLAAVKKTKETMDARLKELETTKKTSEEGLALRRAGLTEKILEYQTGQKRMNATNEAMSQYSALPPNRQHSRSASTIADAMEKKYGFRPSTEDIMKGKEKREPGESMTADQSANLVIKTIAQAAGDAGAADVIDPVTGAVDFGRLIHKSARDQQAFIDSIRTKGKLKEFAGIKDSLEIVARDAETKLKGTKEAVKSMADTKAKLPPIDSKEIQDALATGKPFIYEKDGHKFKLEGKGKSQQWVVVE